ncbi:ABC-type nitrate/sulfonate/bicarbonate transport system, permease component [Sinosporangium album]|uniref:ABC-type nitrate/sulfonate/bicarbonate transport system, permease component n=1 Tax=Sinosporangium album TaxID=504805 RepID=A0A1G7ZVB1_9ACTN|nr:ABC transporter permease [Sinosporangium album]SDH12628.1 ABC-type nitrate/sulfonate/bicarbonate transport system, permease component [Sinosporangium album]
MTAAVSVRVPSRSTRLGRTLGNLALHWAIVIVALAAWQTASTSSGSAYFPPPSKVFSTMWDLLFSGPPPLFLTDLVLGDILTSVWRLFAGWAIAAILGVAGGVLIGSSSLVSDLFKPVMDFMRSIPGPALVPVFLVLLGTGSEMRVSLIAFVAVWPVLLNTVEGVRGVDRVKRDTASVFSMGRLATLRHVTLPAASPKIVAGLRVAVALALNVMVLSELVAGTDGIGHFVNISQAYFRIADMWSGIVVIIVLGLALNVVFRQIENRLLRWHADERRR